MDPRIRSAVANAVDLVNANAGRATVHLLFHGEPELDFVANAARLEGDIFKFEAGIEAFSGTVDELAEIRAELVN